jgi:hypothetical protein
VIKVPKIIHQIAPSDKTKWHPFWFKCQQSWLDNFSGFEYRLWNDEDEINEFVLKNYSQYATLYNKFPVQIMKIDFARLCILHHYGGIYGDMDYFVYKNFYNDLNSESGMVENLTEEYTTAVAENCLMYSIPNSRFFYECLKYCKACFIHFRSTFKEVSNEDWRSVNNDFVVNNTTGSGMISAAYKQLNKGLNIQLLPGVTFNNRPASYDSSFIGKHVHSSIWGKQYIKHSKNKVLIRDSDGSMWSIYSPDDNNSNLKSFPAEEFDFYHDYTNGNYLKNDNLEHIKTLLSKAA